MDKKAIIEALRDKPQLGRPDIKGIPRRVTDAVNRNIATLLGTPVDTVTNAINLGIAGAGTLGHKLGLVSTPPNVIENPIGGSEWFGQQMEQRGMVSPERNTYNEVMAGLLMPAATTRAAKTLFNAEQQAARNIAAPDTLNTPGFRGQRGAVGFVYPQQEALDIAQRNAAKPVSEGGLGLPPNNTAMDRAKAMGFDTDAYHATDFDIRNLDKAFLGLNTKAPSAKKAFFSAKHPRTTYAYIDKGVTGTDPTHTVLYGKSADQIRKEIEVEAAKKGLKPYQIRDQFYENLPKIYENNLNTLAKQRTEIRKQIPGHSVLGRHFPDMEKATPQQIQALNSVEDAIEELNAIRAMAFRTQLSLNEVDDIVEHAGKATNAGANIMPLKLRTQNAQYFDDANQGYRNDTFSNRIDEAIANKKDLAVIQNTQDGFKQTDTIYGVINPAIIRSRFAAFDPAKINQSDLLGYADPRLLGLLGLGTAGGIGLYNYLGK